MSLDEQPSQGFVLLPRLLDTAGTATPGGAAEAVPARATGRTPEGVADVTVRPDGSRPEKVDGTTVRRDPDARPPAVRGPAPIAHPDPAPEVPRTDDRVTGPWSRS